MIYKPSKPTYLLAKSLLEKGELVAFPTETVYGLGANALDSKAVDKIFITKGRPANNPIIVHLGDKSQITDYAEIVNPLEQLIIDNLMPGPLTILLHKKPNIPDIVTAGSEYVGIRIPINKVANSLLNTVNLPIAAPSANISTKPSPTSAQMVLDYLHDKVPMIIDGGDCEVGIESTVVKVEDNRIIITRPGYITLEDIQNMVSDYDVSVHYAENPSNITPGNMYKHYAPQGKVNIFQEFTLEIIENIKNSTQETALIVTIEWIENNPDIHHNLGEKCQVFVRGSKNNLISCAKNLFVIYHECDKKGIEHIHIESLPEVGLGYAIMNRVKKSSQQN